MSTDGKTKKYDDADQSIEACRWRLDQARINSVKEALRANTKGNAADLRRMDAGQRTSDEAASAHDVAALEANPSGNKDEIRRRGKVSK